MSANAVSSNRDSRRSSHRHTINGDLLEPRSLIEGGNRLSLVLINLKNFFQLHEIKYFFDVGVDVADSQVNPRGLAFLAKQNQLANHCRGHEIDVFQIDQNLVVVALLDQVDQILTKILNSCFINDPNVLKVNQQNIFFNPGQQS